MFAAAIAIARSHVHRAAPVDAAPETCRQTFVRVLGRPSFIHLLNDATSVVRPDLVEICRIMGIAVEHLPLADDVVGWIDHDASRFVLNSETTATRRRFTLAHQLGHWLYDRKALADHGGVSDGPSYRQVAHAPFRNPDIDVAAERRASQTAVGLVMPAAIMRRLDARGLTTDEVAERLEVAPKALRIRYDQLGLTAR